MRSAIRITLASIVLLGVWQAAGCTFNIPTGAFPGGGTPDGSVAFDLREGLETYQVVANVPSRASGTGDFNLQGQTASGGSITIDPTAITITPEGGADEKAMVAFQVPPEIGALCIDQPLIITVWVADELDTVFESDQVYTATVTLNDSCEATQVEVDPSQLRASTLALLAQGDFAIGISVVAPITGEVVIDELSFELNL